MITGCICISTKLELNDLTIEKFLLVGIDCLMGLFEEYSLMCHLAARDDTFVGIVCISTARYRITFR